ncbi:MAG TPA: acetyl-CoA carboxylase biotin carboxyl carrier protein [Thermoanaerobaculia bacterium]|jgi:acetyl-CoA carboxylase biotin carboxyl carrier protein|nr:acetyl-CoA carboxylase biotin carboxyl carrier protein [Thermoanaerobaculia bacterium]
MLSFKEIKELIDLVSERGLAGVEIERTGFRLRIEGGRPVVNGTVEGVPVASGSSALTAAASTATPAEKEAEDVHVITSPIVGTFYRSPSPESEPFAEVGAKVAKGKTLCIIESMKLMNEIESDVEGEIVAVYARNGQPVEYGEKLFGIRLAA